MNKLFFISFIILLISQFSFAQNFDKKKLDQYFNALEENDKFMGSVSVRQNGKVIYSKAIGLADIENNIKATENTKYRIGSISKTFTAVLALKAVEEGKLNLNQTIDQWFPNILNADKIKISDLLNHRSGIHNFTTDPDYLNYYTQPNSEEKMIETITQAGSDFLPNTNTAYSNSNYVLLTFILEKAFDKTYSELVQEYIAEPLGLVNTYVFDEIKSQNNEAKSYRFTGSWEIQPETHYSVPLGAGAIISTSNEITKFSDALFNEKLLKAESLQSMKNIINGLGFGLFQIPFYEKIAYGHSGEIDGFSAVFAHFEEDEISYALLSNASNFNNNNITLAVLSAVFNKNYDIPTFSVYNHTQEELQQFVGVYSSTQIPLKISVSIEENTLIAQATGQSSFPLHGTEENKFEFEQAGIVMEFQPAENRMILYQAGGEFTYTKE